ncbi:MAG: hypothetical protein ACKER6_00125 [Candidatus Hodgkinia cicadicola]
MGAGWEIIEMAKPEGVSLGDEFAAGEESAVDECMRGRSIKMGAREACEEVRDGGPRGEESPPGGIERDAIVMAHSGRRS